MLALTDTKLVLVLNDSMIIHLLTHLSDEVNEDMYLVAYSKIIKLIKQIIEYHYVL